MDDFVRRQNIERFRRLLAQETDPARRAALERLLAEEEARSGGQPPGGPRRP